VEVVEDIQKLGLSVLRIEGSGKWALAAATMETTWDSTMVVGGVKVAEVVRGRRDGRRNHAVLLGGTDRIQQPH